MATAGRVRRRTNTSRPPSESVTTLSYPSFSAVPGGSVNVIMTPGAGNAQVVSNTLQEGNSTATSGGKNSGLVLPDIMAVTTTISVTITVGALSSAANNRAVGPGVWSADGTRGIYFRVTSASATAALFTWIGGTETQKTSSTQVGTPGDTFTLAGTLTSGVWTWTITKNIDSGGTPIAALTWEDATHIMDLPGPNPGTAFRRQYSGGHYPSRGIAALSATAA